MNKDLKIAENSIASPLVNIRSRAIIETAIATAIAVFVPAVLAHTSQNQFIVGPIVNAVLFWVAWRVGVANALFIAVVPSLIALFRGMLPPQAAAVIPFIILGNCAMVLVFAGTRCGAFLKIFLAALAKTAVIVLPAIFILNLPQSIGFMMSWPQFITALAGGFLAVMLKKIIGRESDIST